LAITQIKPYQVNILGNIEQRELVVIFNDDGEVVIQNGSKEFSLDFGFLRQILPKQVTYSLLENENEVYYRGEKGSFWIEIGIDFNYYPDKRLKWFIRGHLPDSYTVKIPLRKFKYVKQVLNKLYFSKVELLEDNIKHWDFYIDFSDIKDIFSFNKEDKAIIITIPEVFNIDPVIVSLGDYEMPYIGSRHTLYYKGNIYFFIRHSDNNIYYFYSTDNGETWNNGGALISGVEGETGYNKAGFDTVTNGDYIFISHYGGGNNIYLKAYTKNEDNTLSLVGAYHITGETNLTFYRRIHIGYRENGEIIVSYTIYDNNNSTYLHKIAGFIFDGHDFSNIYITTKNPAYSSYAPALEFSDNLIGQNGIYHIKASKSGIKLWISTDNFVSITEKNLYGYTYLVWSTIAETNNYYCIIYRNSNNSDQIRRFILNKDTLSYNVEDIPFNSGGIELGKVFYDDTEGKVFYAVLIKNEYKFKVYSSNEDGSELLFISEYSVPSDISIKFNVVYDFTTGKLWFIYLSGDTIYCSDPIQYKTVSGGNEYTINISDNILLYETTVKWVDLYNTILNTLSVSEGKADIISLTLEDVFTLNELVYYSVTLNQLLQEITLQEWTNLGGAIFTQLITDVIDLTEQSGLLLGVNLQDDIFIIEDKLSKINSMLKEDINLTESRDYKKVLLALLSDIIALNEIAQKIYTGFMKESESVNLSEKQSKRLEMVLLSILNVSENLLKTIGIQFEDNLTLTEVYNTALLTSIITDVLLNETVSEEVKAQLLSILGLNEDLISLKQGVVFAHDIKEIYSLIIFTKLLNSDITTIKKLYSIIQREVELFK